MKTSARDVFEAMLVIAGFTFMMCIFLREYWWVSYAFIIGATTAFTLIDRALNWIDGKGFKVSEPKSGGNKG